jgi:hypothetical protein
MNDEVVGDLRRMGSQSLAGSLARYSLAAVGPIGSALSQFALSLVLLRRLEPDAFGSFSFLLVVSQLGLGIWSALFCAPLPTLMASGDSQSRGRLLDCLLATNLVATALAFVLLLAVGIAVNLSDIAALLFACYSAAALLRWFARAQAYATGAPLRTMSSDLVYTGALLLNVLAMLVFGAASLESAFGALFLCVVLGLFPFGADWAKQQFIRFRPRDTGGYMAVWRLHSKWSLLGVLTTELTANAHVYIVTFAYGASAFAPLAASALLIRPINVTMNALSEYERAQMARHLGEQRTDLALSAVKLFRVALAVTLVTTAVASTLLLWLAPRLVFPAQYGLGVLSIGTALWMTVSAARLARLPESVLLQAAGAFRVLAFASVLSSVGSVVSVIALMALFGPLWSIAGILFGELLMAIWIFRQAARWRSTSGNKIKA